MHSSNIIFLIWTIGFSVLLANGNERKNENHVLSDSRSQLTEIVMEMPGVQPNERESYLCMATKIDSNQDSFIVKFTPRASRHIVHHMLLFGCAWPGSQQNVWNCGSMHTTTVIPQYPEAPVCSEKSMIIYAWAMDAPGLDLPEEVGFKIGGTTGFQYLILQVHYLNPPELPDHSGLTVSLTDQPLPKRAGVLLLTTGGRIHAHTTEKFDSVCFLSTSLELHPFAYRVHTHRLGKVASGYLVSKRSWYLVGKGNPQEPQMFYPVANTSMVLRQGDILAARCTMENLLDKDVYIGNTSNDEMCNFYIMYWVNGDSILRSDTCWTAGPPVYHWTSDRLLLRTTIPDEDASSL